MAYQVSQTKMAQSEGSISPMKTTAKPGAPWLKGMVTLVLLIAIIGGGVYALTTYFNPLSLGVNLQTEWQAVFLTNGQVYFGKIVKIGDEYVVLKNIYYLQVVNQPLQRSQEGEAEAQPAPQQPEQRLTLIKLGNELHGPRDEMVINRDHVILFEDLKDDSRVVQAINDYIKGQQDRQE